MLKLSNLESIGKPVYKFQNNHSVDFDGVDDFIQLGEPISYTEHTISTWVKFTNETYSRVIFDARDSNADGITIFVTDLEKITYRIGDGSGSDLTSDSLTINEWHHIVATYDGTTQKLYINGSLNQSATTSKTIDTTTNAKIGIVAYVDTAAFIGKIDELAIYDRALEEEEVTQIYRIKYGANLVQNGNFDELGSELVTNGDFATDSDWTKGTGWSIANGVASCDGSQSSSSLFFQNLGDLSNKTVKLSFVVSNYSAGQISTSFFGASGTTGHNVTANGNYSFFIAVQSGHNGNTGFTANSSFIGSIDNVSVKQVDPNNRWTLPTGATFADSKVVFANASGSFYQSLQVFSEGTKIRVHFTVTNYSSGTIKPLLFGGSSSTGDTVISENGTFTQILTAGAGVNANFGFFLTSNTSLELSNVMVEEQKYVATNLKLNSLPYSSSNLRNYYRFGDGILDTHPLICDMVEPSLGSNYLTGTWDSGTGWTNILNGVRATGNGNTRQNLEFTDFVGKVYKLTYTLSNVTDSTTLSGKFGGGSTQNIASTNGTHIEYLVNDATVDNFQLISGGNWAGDVTDISLQKINGVPGLMTNMSEADITNDVPG